MSSLPTGRFGATIALALTVASLGALWLGVVAPLTGWYADRSSSLTQRIALEKRMIDLAATLPELRRQVSQAPTGDTLRPDRLLKANSDSIAAATLQQRLQDLAATAGVTLATVETLPARDAPAALRRIALRVTATTSWSALVHLLQSIQETGPTMVVEELELRSALDLARPQDPPISASFGIVAFRAGGST